MRLRSVWKMKCTAAKPTRTHASEKHQLRLVLYVMLREQDAAQLAVAEASGGAGMSDPLSTPRRLLRMFDFAVSCMHGEVHLRLPWAALSWRPELCPNTCSLMI